FYARIGDLALAGVALAAVLGAVLGDNLGYLIGRRFGRGFVERHGRKLLVTPQRLRRADAYYRAHGGKTVFLGRFIPVVRSVGCILAGIARMDWRRFFAYDLGGAVLWGVGHSILGYAIGASYERWKGYLTPIGLAVLAALLLLIGASKVLAARRSVRADLAEQEAEEGAGQALMPEHKSREFYATSEADFGYTLGGVGRFRVNVFRQRGNVGLAIRRVRSEIPTFEELRLPPVIKDLAGSTRGLVLLTGPTGTGKTTTIASMIGYINRTRRAHIVTIEDPIEVVHDDDLSIIQQREIGQDTESYAAAL